MPQNLYEVLWIFFVYAVIGWAIEVAFHALKLGKFINRGFLNGPYCPIYGVGVLIVVTLLNAVNDNLFLLFIGSTLLTTVLEFITGFLLEKIFHSKWWDYSNLPFNIKGYICLEFSIYWGIGCTFILRVIHPAIYKMITFTPKILGIVLITLFGIVFIVDCCITVFTVLKLNRKLKKMDELAAKIRSISDEIGENIYEGVTSAKEKSEEFQENHEEFISKINEVTTLSKQKLKNTKENYIETKEKLIKEREELKIKYRQVMEEKNFGLKRLIKAHPDMKSHDQNDVLDKLKKYFNKSKKEKEDRREKK